MSEAGPTSSHGGDQHLPAPEPILFYGVIPKPWCEHLAANVSVVPTDGVNATLPCLTCQDTSENWMCLKCFEVHCSRFINEDMKRHAQESGHQLVLSFGDLSVWCFGCDSYVNNEITQPAKRAAYLSKFGEEFPQDTTGSNQENAPVSDEDVER